MIKKKYNIKTLEIADFELQDSILWYKKIDFDLALNFLTEYDKVLDYLEQNPLLFKKTKFNFHEVNLKTFPYVVIFRIYENEKLVVITSVFHDKLNPKTKNITSKK